PSRLSVKQRARQMTSPPNSFTFKLSVPLPRPGTNCSNSLIRGMSMSDLTDSTLFKALDGLRPMHGDGRYPGVGRWTRHLDPQQLQPCAYGYHLTRGPQVFGWL